MKPGGIGLLNLYTLLVGSIVGTGWIAATSIWIADAGPGGAIVAFACGAAIMVLITMCFAELMTLLPDSGGMVGYAYAAFGVRTAYIVGWMLILSFVTTLGFFVVALPNVLKMAFPGMFGGEVRFLGAHFNLGPGAVGLLGTVLIGLANLIGAGTAARIQDLLVGAKLTLVIVMGVIALAVGRYANAMPLFAGTTSIDHLIGISAVLITTPFWFSGFEVLPQALSERRVGLRLDRIGWIMLAAIATSLLFYGTIIAACSLLVPVTSAEETRGSVYGIFRDGTGSRTIATIVIILALSGVASSWNATLFAIARIIRTMARAHLVPAIFSVSHQRYGTPVFGILVPSVIGFALGVAGEKTVAPLISAASIPLMVVFFMACAAVLRLRRIRPSLPRPFRTPFGRTVPIMGMIASVVLIILAVHDFLNFVSQENLSLMITLLVFASAIPVLWFLGRPRRQSLPESSRIALLATIEG